MLERLLKQGIHYASGTLLLSIASLISFPILTRYLPVEEYGYLSLLTTIVGILVAIYKCGLQQSIFRYYKGDNEDLISSSLVAFLYSSVVTTIFCVAVIILFGKDEYVNYMYVIILIALFQSLRSLIMSTYASQENSFFVNLVNVAYKYGSLLFMLLFIFYYEKNASSVLLSILVSDFIILILVLTGWFLKYKFSSPTKGQMRLVFLYGMPLMFAEVLQMAHAFSDRFLVEYYLGIQQVALYAAPYAISKIISDIVFGGIAVALVPIYMSMWKQGEFDNTIKFLNKVSDYYLLIFPIAIGGLYYISVPLMGLLASDKYIETTYILPIAFLGVGMFASTFIYSAGLRIDKNQVGILKCVIESLILNVVLNVLLIPTFGLAACAWSTVASYFWLSFRYYLCSKHLISISINYKNLLVGSLIGGVIFSFSFVTLQLDSHLENLIFRMLIGLIVAVAGLLLTQAEIRGFIKLSIKKLREKNI
jgi:O-antigen/teichoic acid export membrane protein